MRAFSWTLRYHSSGFICPSMVFMRVDFPTQFSHTIHTRSHLLNIALLMKNSGSCRPMNVSSILMSVSGPCLSYENMKLTLILVSTFSMSSTLSSCRSRLFANPERDPARNRLISFFSLSICICCSSYFLSWIHFLLLRSSTEYE